MSDDVLRTLSHAFDWRTPPLDWPVTSDVGPGLRGVIAGETRVMWLDPSSGRLAYRGVPIESLADAPDFEEVSYLLITGSRPGGEDPDWQAFRQSLRGSRRTPQDVLLAIRDCDPGTHPTRMLRAGVSALGCHELSVDDDLSGEKHWRELRIVGQVAGLLAEVIRHRGSSGALGPDQGSSLAEGLLTVLQKTDTPSPDDIRMLDLLWVLYAAHGVDAPTFTSMVVASCLADPYANVVAGLSALRGPRQGGASEQVLEQLLAREGPGEAETWVERTLARGDRIAGFGHPDYRMPDPRVVILRKAVASVARRKGSLDLYEVARAMEDVATRALSGRGIHININFYGALLFHLLGAEPPVAPCLIAVARMAGLLALVRESLAGIRIYRPISRYVGPVERTFQRADR
jgi:citrate synthase